MTMYEARVLSGMRPTGSLHLGHYHGVLKNWVRLQAEYPCLFFVADWHALTTDYENPAEVQAIRILLDRPKDWSTAALKELKAKLAAAPERFTVDFLQKAHQICYRKALADIISMVKHAAEDEEPLLNVRLFGRPLGLAPDFTVLDQADMADLMDLIRGEQQSSRTVDKREQRRFPRGRVEVRLWCRCRSGGRCR